MKAVEPVAERVWISWNEQRRNVGLAQAVNARLYMTDRDSSRCQRLIREFYESWKIIRHERPSICFTMNPSIFSSLWLSLLAAVYRFRLVTDLHTPNIKLTGLKKAIFNMVLNFGIKRSDVVIVTNDIYQKDISLLNSKVIVVPDPLPTLRGQEKTSTDVDSEDQNKTKIIFICSFDPDEPIHEVFSLDAKLDEFDILVTGDWKKRFETPPHTRNISFTGFVSKKDFDKLLLSADGVLVLTKEEGCLCCGAYEAFSAGKPLILSRTEALQNFFGGAPIYTENTSDSILMAFITLKGELVKRTEKIIAERPSLQKKFRKGIAELEEALHGF